MQDSLYSHIMYLENTIRAAKERLNSLRLSRDEVLDLELQLTLAESALMYYRKAYELELSVSGSEPFGEGGAKTSSFDRPKDSNREENDAGKAAIRVQDRKRAARLRRRVTESRLLQIAAFKKGGCASK